ncbi:MAG: condensation domain-containing protein [Burkholderiaceae bacterium]
MTTSHDPSASTVAESTGLEIAIIGMAGRFPGAADVDAFWRNLCEGVESVRTYTDEELLARGVPAELVADPDYVKTAVAFEGAELFDAAFFGYSPREAERLDPQHRVFLECAWEAMENAGYDTEQWPGTVAVFAGAGANVYLLRHLLPRLDLGAGSGVADLLDLVSGNGGETLCTRVAYKLNLRGPAVTVQTGCSTSLSAVHLACQSLLAGECDMALAGGVTLSLLQSNGYRFQPGAIFSPDGHCRAFDAAAAGTVLGSGAGVVVLKRLDDALREGDHVEAVIRSTAANNDGADKIGFTAPSVNGQAAVIRAAHVLANVSPATISYVEAHGSGTTLGDPIEVAALTQAFRLGTDRTGFCAVGSVKTNVGHLDCAAGVAGLIKTTLALKHRTLPASLNFERPNPAIDFESSPFYVNVMTQAWSSPGPLRAGVSGFGIGGANVHAVLEEAPEASEVSNTGAEGGWLVLPVSAASTAALQHAIERLAMHLRAHPGLAMADVAHTLQVGRRALPYRIAVIAKDHVGARRALEQPGLVRDKATPEVSPEVVFLFPGACAQPSRMGQALYRDYPVFRDEVDRCLELARQTLRLDLRPYFSLGGGEALANEQRLPIEESRSATFITSYAMAKLWLSLGVEPALMLGYGSGEYAAACVAGVCSTEDALRLIVASATLQLGTLGVQASTAQSPDPSPTHGLAPAAPVLATFKGEFASMVRHAPRIPIVSNATGRFISTEEATDPAYWAAHLRPAVPFSDCLETVLAQTGRVLLEVGPGNTLTSLASRHAKRDAAVAIVASESADHDSEQGSQQWVRAVGRLWSVGVPINWTALARGQQLGRVALPAYPFQRRRYWIESDAKKGNVRASDGGGYSGENIQQRPALSTEYEPPATELERQLASIWSERLGIAPIGIRDNLYELGGSSLLAIQILARVGTGLKCRILPSEFFRDLSIAGLADLIGKKQAIERQVSESVPLVVVPRDGVFRLAPVQRRLWVFDRLAGGNRQARAAYNDTLVCSMDGDLNRGAVRFALDHLVARHEALRTRYPEGDDGEPISVIVERFELPVTEIDLSHLPEADVMTEFASTRARVAGEPFDLSRGPLMRVALVRLAERRHLLLVSVHHIVFDGWSTAIFTKEFCEIYRALCEGKAPALAPLPIQYADYAAWHDQVLQRDQDGSKAFWKHYLEGAPLVSVFAADRSRPKTPGFDGDILRLALGQPLSSLAAQRAREWDVSVFTLLLSAYLLTLHRHTGAAEVVVGTDVAGRDHPALEALIGFFVNVVPIRSRLDDAGIAARRWVRRVHESVAQVFDHQSLPLDRILSAARIARGQGANPLLQMLFVMQNVPKQRFDVDGLAISVMPADTVPSKFDQAVFVHETDAGLAVDWVFSTALYDRTSVSRVAEAWQAALRAICADPDRPIDSVPVSSASAGASMTTSTASRPNPAPKSKLDMLASAVRQPAARAAQAQVRLSFPSAGRQFPVMIEALERDLDPVWWASQQRDFIEDKLRTHAGIVFRNFGLTTPQDFERFSEAMEPSLYGSYGDLPKKEGGVNTYRSTPYPENQMILYHNECSHTDRWPRKQWFFCELPSRVGGITPIVDCRELLTRLPAEIVDEMARKGLLYVRNFHPKLDVSWQHFFKTEDRAEVEARLAGGGIEWRWLDGDVLQTRTRGPAVITHPLTGARAFFNQVQLHHVSCLEPDVREDLLGMVGLERMPRHVYFGDGSPIPDSMMAVIGQAYEACAVRFDWQRGDVVMLDNMLAAHARDPYEEPRKIVVAMGAMYERDPQGRMRPVSA